MMPEDRKLLYRLIKQWTRAEIMARFGPFWPESGDNRFTVLKKEDEIRELLFGTKDLMELGQRWGLPINPCKDDKEDRNIKGRLTVKGLQNGRTGRGHRESYRKPLL